MEDRAPAKRPAPWPRWICPEHRLPLDGWRCRAEHVVPVVDSIPRFVHVSTYADAFGAQWLRFSKTQLDSHTGTSLSRNRARRCLGEQGWEALRELHVLECGCGSGRFTE